MRVVSIANQKGGCGKTTTAVNLASALARMERRVLVLDNDPQGNATIALGADPEHYRLTMRDLYLASDVSTVDVRLEIRKGLDLVPAEVDLSTVEQELVAGPGRLGRLATRLAESPVDYDFVIVDNPPSIGLLTFNALMASDEAIVPVDAGRFCMDAVERFHEMLELLVEERGHSVPIWILPNGFDMRTCYARKLLEEMDESLHDRVLESRIHATVRLREAADAGLPIDVYDGHSRAALDFEHLADEILTRSGGAEEGVVDKRRRSAIHEGPRILDGQALFVVDFPGAQHVAITGDFSEWATPGIPLRRAVDGRWSVSVPLTHGHHEYRFLVDGEWHIDPRNSEKTLNEFGEHNSVLRIEKAARASA